MKIIHNRYRSYPPPSWVRELHEEERIGELRRRVVHGLGRLGPWQHLEVCGFKLEGFESAEIASAIRYAITKQGLSRAHYPIRAGVNVVRVWKIPVSCEDWRVNVKKAMEAGAVYDHGHVEYMPIKKAKVLTTPATYLDIMEREKKELEEKKNADDG